MQGHLNRILRFVLVGALGFVIDSTTLYAGLFFGLNLYSGRILSYFIAATGTWFLHRRITFAMRTSPGIAEWLNFLAANALGGLSNVACYIILIDGWAFFRSYPVVAVGIGALVSLAISYILNLKVVFRSTSHRHDRSR